MKDLRLYLSVAAALFIVYIVAQYNRPKPIDWKTTYLRSDKIPFGTYILFDQLPAFFPGARVTTTMDPAYNVLNGSEKSSGGVYLIIAAEAAPDRLDYKALVNYIRQGNSVFIAANRLGDRLSKALKTEIGVKLLQNETQRIPLRFAHPDLAGKAYTFDQGIGQEYFTQLDTTAATVLGTGFNGNANFVKFNMGRGALYLLAGSRLMTNYTFLQPGGAEYVSAVFSRIPGATKLVWDEHFTRGVIQKKESPLYVILSNRGLREAYYITFFGLLAFVIYEVKRRQRIIPVEDPVKNTTVEFVNVVGQVYYQQRDNRNIASKQVNYLLEHIRSKYQLKTNETGGEFAALLAARSGVDKETADQLVMYVAMVNSGRVVSDKELIGLTNHIEKFYNLT